MTIRERYEEMEKILLGPYGVKSTESKGRLRPEPPCEIRTVFQRDRDRITHSKEFRRLMHKTQVFISPEGDHFRTRLTHTLEVSQIARTIARALRLNEDLTEAMALGHDLGHTPFGHAGERTLNKICTKLGGFRHYEQSLRVCDRLAKGGRGLNLTYEVRDGILHHSGSGKAHTLEGCILKYADRIAYINHDIDDAVRGKVLRVEQIPKELLERLGETHRQRINTMILGILEASMGQDHIAMVPQVEQDMMALRAFLFESVYTHEQVKLREEEKADHVIITLYEHFMKHPEKLPEENRRTIEEEGVERAVCDHIAGMTDRYAINLYLELCVPKCMVLT
jgi:dGTPase